MLVYTSVTDVIWICGHGGKDMPCIIIEDGTFFFFT